MDRNVTEGIPVQGQYCQSGSATVLYSQATFEGDQWNQGCEKYGSISHGCCWNPYPKAEWSGGCPG